MQRLTWLSIILAFLIGIVLDQTFLRRFLDLNQGPTFKNEDDLPYVHILQGVHLVESLYDNKEWELNAESALNKRDTQLWDLKNVQTIFFSREGQKIMVTGKQAVFNMQSRALRIYDQVHIQTSEGQVVETQQVEYQSGDKSLFTLSEAQVTDALMGQLLGGRLRVWVGKKELQLSGGVHGELKVVKGEKPIQVWAQEISIRSPRRELRLLHQVKVEGAWGEYKAEQAKLLWARGNFQKLKSIQLDGQVYWKLKDQQGRAEHVFIDFEKSVTRMSGSPVLWQKGQKLQGEHIFMSHDDGRVWVEKMTYEKQ